MTPPSLPGRADLDELLSRHLGGLFAQDVPPERLARAVADLYDALLTRLRPALESAWLIEDTRARPSTWWDGLDFTTDSLRAIRFARQSDAERTITTVLPKRYHLIATEHMWS